MGGHAGGGGETRGRVGVIDPDAAGIVSVGDRVALGPLRPELFPLHVGWLNDPEVAWNMFGRLETRTLEDEAVWLEREDARPDSRFVLLYRREPAGWRPIGVASLTEIDEERRSATFRMLIGEARDRGLGLGGEAARLVIEYATDVLRVETLELNVFEWNVAAIRLYQRLGFREIARREGRAVRDGRSWDETRMAWTTKVRSR